jgi:hypothetical protein
MVICFFLGFIQSRTAPYSVREMERKRKKAGVISIGTCQQKCHSHGSCRLSVVRWSVDVC